MKKRFSFTIVILCFVLMLSGCFLLNPIPKEYIEGIRLPREYPDDDLEIYDDATVFEVEEDDEEITLTYGTEDDIDDVIDFYEDLFDDNNLTIDEQQDDKDEFYAKGAGEGFVFEIEAEQARGEIEEKLFETVVTVTVEFVENEVIKADTLTPAPSQPTPAPSEATATPYITILEDEYDPTWADNYVPFYIDVTNLSDEDLGNYIIGRIWYYTGYYNGSDLEYGDGSTVTYYQDGSFRDALGNDAYTGSWYIMDHVMYCDYENGYNFSLEIGLEFAGNTIYLYYYDNDSPGSFFIYATVPLESIMFYTEDYEMTSLISDRTFDCLYYMYADGSAESLPPTSITINSDGTFAEIFEGWTYRGTWNILDGYFEFGYDDSEPLYAPIEVDYDTINDIYYIFFADETAGNEGNYWVYISR